MAELIAQLFFSYTCMLIGLYLGISLDRKESKANKRKVKIWITIMITLYVLIILYGKLHYLLPWH